MYNKPFVVSKKKGETFIKYYSGELEKYDLLDQIDETVEQIFVLPFCQAKERGFKVKGEEKILSLLVDDKKEYSYKEFIETFSVKDTILEGDLHEYFSKEEYKNIVKDIVEKEIGNGEGANFLIAQKLSGKVKDFDIEVGLSLFKKILETEQGYYLAFIFFDGEKIFIGASPERNVSVEGKKVRMNPISGTFRKSGYENYLDFKKDFTDFLRDKKEINELFMASDEELKMMSNICSSGGLIVGPILKEMSHLVHTEYLLSGDSNMSSLDILRQSMWASTVIGSPIESAFKIAEKYEKESRKYYAGAICHLNGDSLDSAIMIRTLQLDMKGYLEIYVGASLVKDSDPESEYKELEAKIKGVMSAFGRENKSVVPSKSFTQEFYLDDEIQELLQKRNQYLSKVWFFKQEQDINKTSPNLSLRRGIVQKTIAIIDNEDDFTSMLVHLLHMLGYKTDLHKSNEIESLDEFTKKIGENTIVLVGPGPGNPLDDTEKNKINLEIIDYLEKNNKKYFGICLGHQLICRYKNIELQKKSVPTQGEQIEIDLFGKREKVGFYNTFAGFVGRDRIYSVPTENTSYNQQTGEIHALRGKHFFSLQFHPESILSQNGLEILRENLGRLYLNK